MTRLWIVPGAGFVAFWLVWLAATVQYGLHHAFPFGYNLALGALIGFALGASAVAAVFTLRGKR